MKNKQSLPSCPRCGSKDVEVIIHRHNYAMPILLLCVILILISGLYIALPVEVGLRSDVADVLVSLMAVAAFAILIFARHISDNFKCNQCGKTFYHLKSD